MCAIKEWILRATLAGGLVCAAFLPISKTLADSVSNATPANAETVFDQIEPDPATSVARPVILVKPRAGLPDDDFLLIIQEAGLTVLGVNSSTGVYSVEAPEESARTAIEILRNNPHIEFAEPNSLAAPMSFAGVPNDPDYANEWHLLKLEEEQAWPISDGTGITIALIDTGVNAAHEDLVGQILSGWNIIDNSSDTSDIAGHGTLMAGVIAAATNNGRGVASPACGAKILPVRVTNLPAGYAYDTDIANGIIWAADHGAKVINVAFSGAAVSASIEAAAQYARNRGALALFAAGNDGTLHTEANSPYLLIVGATDQSDQWASFSAYGNFIDVWAPGTLIATTNKSGGYSRFYGTSPAVGIASGLAAQLLSANPSLTPAETELAIRNTVDKLAGNIVGEYGDGRLNAAAALTYVVGLEKDTAAPAVGFMNPQSGTYVQGLVAIDVQATDDRMVNRVELYVDDVLLGTDMVAPYGFSWNAATHSGNASARLTAKAYDAAGNRGTSEITVVLQLPDTTPPTVSFAHPRNGDSIEGLVSTEVVASDHSGISRIELYLGDALIGTDATAPYIFAWNAADHSPGTSIRLTAKAYDPTGNIGSSAIALTIRTPQPSPGTTGNPEIPPVVGNAGPAPAAGAPGIPPVIQWISPRPGNPEKPIRPRGGRFIVKARVTVNDGSPQVALLIDGREMATQVRGRVIRSVVKARHLGRGQHVLRLIAMDSGGNRSEHWASVEVQ